MAKLPSDADLISARPNTIVGGQVRAARRQAPPQMGQLAQGELALGQGLNQAGQDIAVATLRERDRYEDTRVEDAFNQLRQKQLDLTLGKDDGFANLKGGDAVNKPILKDWTQKFDESSKQIEDSLGSEREKERFRMRSAVAKANYTGDIMQHVARESNTYAAGVYKGTVDLETRQAMANWSEPDSVSLSLQRVGNAVSREADRLGMGKDDPQRAAMSMHAVSGIHAAVITQALQNDDPVYAQSYYEANKDSIDPTVVKTLGHQVSEGVQKQAANNYQADYIANRNDRKSLSKLEERVSADPTLDETRKNVLLGRIGSRGDVLEVREAHEADKRQRALQAQVNGVNRLTLAGYEPTAEQMLPLIAASKGTDMEGEVQQMVATANVTRSFRLATPQQQEATITQLETEARKDPTKFDVTVIDRFKKIYSNQQNEIKSDPVTFATRQGLVAQDDKAAKPIDFSDPQSMGDTLQSRFALSRSMSSRYQAPMKPLTKEEADSLSGLLKKASPTDKSTMFAQLSVASGGDYEGYKALIAQLSPDDPVTAHAGIMAGRGRMSTNAGFDPDQQQSSNVALRILRGQAVLHPSRKDDGSPDHGKLWPMPKDEELAKQFSSYERDVFAGKPEARNGFMQTAKAIYADMSVQAGDSSGVLDSSRFDEAMKLSTGGIERWNGKSVVMPWGYSKGQFKDELSRRADDLVDAGRLQKGISSSKLMDMPLESVGDGRYVFKAGDGILVGKDGRPVMVDFNQSPAFRPSGTAPSGNVGDYLPKPGVPGLFNAAKAPLPSVSGKKVKNESPSETTGVNAIGVRG